MALLSRVLLLLLCTGALAGCSGMTQIQQRTLSGGAIGAAGGAALTALTGGSVLLGTALGAGAGAAVGALTSH
jgi:osmotically inducible lipoprotein OsmB